uniref:Uncharacterized protein n=1 Tax=Romanomermis culicivorax TaxID=13658 RepID=A0A915JL79_ROMCU
MKVQLKSQPNLGCDIIRFNVLPGSCTEHQLTIGTTFFGASVDGFGGSVVASKPFTARPCLSSRECSSLTKGAFVESHATNTAAATTTSALIFTQLSQCGGRRTTTGRCIPGYWHFRH